MAQQAIKHIEPSGLKLPGDQFLGRMNSDFSNRGNQFNLNLTQFKPDQVLRNTPNPFLQQMNTIQPI